MPKFHEKDSIEAYGLDILCVYIRELNIRSIPNVLHSDPPLKYSPTPLTYITSQGFLGGIFR